MQLYPMKFSPIIKSTIWGGNMLNKTYGKGDANSKIGESWELSGVQDNISVVQNGFLSDNPIEDLIEVYMGDLIGDKVYKQFGIEFPLLFKLIDANDQLSIQVHPDNKMAKERHKAYGKTEMWYVLEAKPGATLINGFKASTDRATYLEHLNKGTLNQLMNNVEVKKGDVIYIPAGRVHSIGAGILLAEIQQTSDITYRIFDWNRTNDKGESRELHTDLAIDAIDFNKPTIEKESFIIEENKSSQLVKSPFFTTNILKLNSTIEKDYYETDSFVVYMCTEGEAIIHTIGNDPVTISKGETVLIPNEISTVRIQPKNSTEILEIYI